MCGIISQGDFPEVLISALFNRNGIRIHPPGSQYAFLQLGKANRAFIPPLGNHGKIMEIFLEVLVFRKREEDGNLVAFLIDYVLSGSSHGNS